jgi:hypothetical protein
LDRRAAFGRSGLSRRTINLLGKTVPCCIEQNCISAADLAEAEPSQIGAALGAIARRPLRRTRMAELECLSDAGEAGALSSASATHPNLAL